MSVKFPQLIYFLDYQTKNLLLRFRLLPVNNSLLLETTVNELYNDPANVNLKQTFFTNPDAEDVFDRTNKQLMGIYCSGYNEIISFRIYVNNIPTTNGLNQLDLILGNTKLRLHLEAFQLEGLKAFINSIVNNYIGYQIDLLKLALEEPISIVEEVVQPEKIIEEEVPSFEEENPILDLLALSPNNLTTYYLTNFLLSQPNLIEFNGEVLKVPLVVTNIYSEAFQLTLYNLISNITLSKDEITSRLKTLYTTLNSILKEDYNSKIPEINIILFLAYLYMLKSMVELSVTNFRIHIYKTYFNALNRWIVVCKKLFNGSNLSIEELKLDPTNNKNSPLYLKNLELIIRQHQYLINIDRNLFLKTILQNLKIDNSTKNNKIFNIGLTNPKLLDIDILLAAIPAITTSSRINFINYSLPNITNDYFFLIDIIENSNINQIEKLNPIVKLHMDTIVKTIFNKIDSNINTQSIVKTNLSTLYLLENFVSPFIQESLESQLFILYQILIPHLYTKYKVSKFIDYFV